MVRTDVFGMPIVKNGAADSSSSSSDNEEDTTSPKQNLFV